MPKLEFFSALASCAVLLCAVGADGAVRGSIRGVGTSYVRPGTSYYTGASVPAVRVPATQTRYFPQTVSMTTTAQCDNKWITALLAEMTDVNNWKCSSRFLPSGTNQSCVITGPYTSTNTIASVNYVCGWILPFFCDDSVHDLVSSTIGRKQAATATLLTGYTPIAGVGNYKVHSELLTWSQSQAACVAEGAHLATPSSTTDYNAIWTLITSALPSQNGVWLGFTDQTVEGTFLTVNNQPICMLESLPYATGEPNGGTAENCLNIGYNQASTVNDFVCTTPLPFICEQTLSSRIVPCASTVSG